VASFTVAIKSWLCSDEKESKMSGRTRRNGEPWRVLPADSAERKARVREYADIARRDAETGSPLLRQGIQRLKDAGHSALKDTDKSK